jgi:hypothetical protein
MNLQRAHTAAMKLRGNADFEEFCEGLGEVANAYVRSALLSTPEMRIDSSAYARGVLDVWIGIEAARLELHPRQVKSSGLNAKVLAGA